MSNSPPLLRAWDRRLSMFSITLGLVSVAAFLLAPASVVETWYSRELYRRAAILAGRAAGWTRVSFFEIGALCLAALLTSWAGLGLSRLYMRRERAGRILARGAIHALALSSLAAAQFVWVWGFSYAREPLTARHPELARPATPGEIRAAATALVACANERAASSRLSAGEIESALRRGMARVLADLEDFQLPEASPPKDFLLFQRVLDACGTSGFTSPWTLEVHVNPSLPLALVPFVLAHEVAHQTGYADETEANFLAYLACLASEDPYLAYSAHLSILLYFESEGAFEGGELDLALAAGPLADRRAARAWSRERVGALRSAARVLYDLYLRSAGRPEGIRSYGRVIHYVARHLADNP